MTTLNALNSLRIKEIFRSLQGESSYLGLPTTFVRLTGCPLRCTYCDSAYAFKGGKRMALDDILNLVKDLGAPYVCVTGGEPLVQELVFDLLTMLADAGFTVSLETSGAYLIDRVDRRVKAVVDIKTPGSKEDHRNEWRNLDLIKPHDEIKFVIVNRDDYEWSKQVIQDKLAHLSPAQILLSPSYHHLSLADLGQWMVDDRLNARLQLQLHKLIWGEKEGV